MDGINLTKLVPSEEALNQRITTVLFKNVKFRIRYISRVTLRTLADRHTIHAFDAKQRTRTPQLDAQAFIKALAKTIVVGWENCTLKTLSDLMVMQNLDQYNDEQLNEEIPFTDENLYSVVLGVHELDNFLQECAVDASLFKAPNAEELRKNSSTSQSTT